MPRPRKPPRLAIRTEDDGRRVWVIRDGQSYIRTRCLEGELELAQTALSGYLNGTFQSRTIDKIDKTIPAGVIYYVSVAGSDVYPIKIGYTTGRVSSRIDGMQTGNPNVLVCLATERGDESLEMHRHRQFRPFHFRGEWYARSGTLMAHIASLPGNVTIAYHEPKDAHPLYNNPLKNQRPEPILS